MNKFILICALLIGSSVFAATNAYDLKINLSKNGKSVSSPEMIVKEGELATITEESLTEKSFIEVVATEGAIDQTKGILMKFSVGLIGKDGKKTISGTPQILAQEGQKAEIGFDNGKERISLSVIAKRKIQ